jgi:hypothetical protein
MNFKGMSSEDMNWINVMQGKAHWRTVVNTVK